MMVNIQERTKQPESNLEKKTTVPYDFTVTVSPSDSYINALLHSMMIPEGETFDRQLSQQKGVNVIRILMKGFLGSL